jgi:Rrf2 family iron-sulfur cluster assembly transcriptional regulator
MALLSKSCVYGLRAAIYVAMHKPGRAYVPIREIAKELDLSFHFLTKIFQQLTESGILKSYRGPTGGVALARPGREISLLDVVESLEGAGLFSECMLGLVHCDDRHPCPLHEVWRRQREELRRMLEGATLQEFAEQVQQGIVCLSDAAVSGLVLKRTSGASPT